MTIRSEPTFVPSSSIDGILVSRWIASRAALSEWRRRRGRRWRRQVWPARCSAPSARRWERRLAPFRWRFRLLRRPGHGDDHAPRAYTPYLRRVLPLAVATVLTGAAAAGIAAWWARRRPSAAARFVIGYSSAGFSCCSWRCSIRRRRSSTRCSTRTGWNGCMGSLFLHAADAGWRGVSSRLRSTWCRRRSWRGRATTCRCSASSSARYTWLRACCSIRDRAPVGRPPRRGAGGRPLDARPAVVRRRRQRQPHERLRAIDCDDGCWRPSA